MIPAVIVLASLLTLVAGAFAFCVRVFLSAPGARSLTTVYLGNTVEVWEWKPWHGWRRRYRVTMDTSHFDYTTVGQTSTGVFSV